MDGWTPYDCIQTDCSPSSSHHSDGGDDGAAAVATTTPAAARFVSPVILPSASVGDLLEYLGDTRTRRRVSLGCVHGYRGPTTLS
jgi:hypothetical protein